MSIIARPRMSLAFSTDAARGGLLHREASSRHGSPPGTGEFQAGLPQTSCESAGISGRTKRRKKFRLHGRPIDVERVIQVHLEGDGPAGDESHLDAVPVLIGGVFHYGPTLEEGLILLVQDEAIAGLPDRVFNDVADLNFPFAFATEVEANRLLLGIVTQCKRFQGLGAFRFRESGS